MQAHPDTLKSSPLSHDPIEHNSKPRAEALGLSLYLFRRADEAPRRLLGAEQAAAARAAPGRARSGFDGERRGMAVVVRLAYEAVGRPAARGEGKELLSPHPCFTPSPRSPLQPLNQSRRRLPSFDQEPALRRQIKPHLGAAARLAAWPGSAAASARCRQVALRGRGSPACKPRARPSRQIPQLPSSSRVHKMAEPGLQAQKSFFFFSPFFTRGDALPSPCLSPLPQLT